MMGIFTVSNSEWRQIAEAFDAICAAVPAAKNGGVRRAPVSSLRASTQAERHIRLTMPCADSFHGLGSAEWQRLPPMSSS